MTSIEKYTDRQYFLEKVNAHLKKPLGKVNKEKNMLHHMAYHYLAWNKISKTRIRYLKAKLRRVGYGKMR